MPAAHLFRAVRRTAAVGLPLAVFAVGVLGATGTAGANPPGPHDPIGAITKVSAPNRSSVQFTGWAADPDALKSNAHLAGLVDGTKVVGAVTDTVWHSVIKAHHTGATPGFVLTVPVPDDGKIHTACAEAVDIGPGSGTLLKCVATPLGTSLNSNQLAAHDPNGTVSWVSGWTGTLHVKGWASDPDVPSRRNTVVVYVDGDSAATVSTHKVTSGKLTRNQGGYSSYDVKIPVSAGTHEACVYAVNVGLGSNSLLGCKAGDTRGAAGTGPVSTPSVNKKIVAEAAKHIGQPYVWGAAGPKSFDCSGLVSYAYHKYGITTPRIAADQFTAARLIPQSRAVPGDLVFWYDTSGYVYHVGIYTGPGETIAAIDEDEGVNHQKLWDNNVSYGSFTHT